MKELSTHVIVILKEIGIKTTESMIEIPPDPGLGDFAFPCFSLAKEFKKSPAEIAKELLDKITVRTPFSKVENNGPYLNFFVDSHYIAEYSLKSQQKKEDDKRETIMVEFSSPNTNKPLHLGHLRNMILGNSLSTIIKEKGHNVIKACLVNDRGVHICKSMLMYEKFGEQGMPDKKPDHYVGDFYVLFNKKVQENPELEQEAQEMLQRWENGDKEIHDIWRLMNNWANEGFQETYDRLGIEFDKFYFESDIYKKGKDLVKKGLENGVFYDDEGAISVELGKLGKKVLLRKDGTSVYMTQDIFLAKKKFDDFSLDKSIYIVGSEQNLHFQQLFKILGIMGFSFAERCYHLSYGMVSLPEGKMKSREGTVVDADDLITEMKELAKEEIKKRHELSEAELRRRAQIIGLGALRFYLLKTDPTKDMVYDPKTSISFEGETGPYVQYVYARISSILRKSQQEISEDIDFNLFNENEINIIKKISYFWDVAADAKSNMKPNLICRYLIDLCQMFNEYYHNTPVLKADEEQKKARLLLINKIKKTIADGLFMLNIDVLEEM